MREWAGRYFVPDVLTKERLGWERRMLCNICDGENGCTECLCQGANKSYYEEWLKKEKEKVFPSLIPNTVIELVNEERFLVVWETLSSVYTYRLKFDQFHSSVEFDNDVRFERPLESDVVCRVYGSRNIVDGIREPLRWSSLVAIFEGSEQYLLWEKPEHPAPVEMTMSELKEKLGYEVKIVEEHHD